MSHSDLSRTFLVGGGLLVPSSLSGPPVLKQIMQMVTMVPGQGGWFQSVCFPEEAYLMCQVFSSGRCSVAQLCPTLCDPMNRRTPGVPVHHQLPDITQTHVHRVGDAIQPSHPLSSPSPPAPNPSQHQGLFQ